MKRLKMKAFGNEAIHFQSGLFHTDLTMAVGRLRNAKKEKDIDEACLSIEKIIKEHTGIIITVFVAKGLYNLNVLIPKVDKNHPLMYDFFKQSIDFTDGLAAIHALNKVNLDAISTIDRKTGRVYGILADVNYEMNIGEAILASSALTDAEIAAMVLHEVGHLFAYFEYIGYTYKANLVMNATTRAFRDQPEPDKRKVILNDAERMLGEKFEDKEKLSKAKNSETLEAVFITNTIQRMRSELGYNMYDIRSWEQAADEFASRHGAAKDMASGLSKYYKSSFALEARSTTVYFMMEAAKLLAFTGSLVLTAATGNAPLLMALVTVLAVEYPRASVYDEPKVRIEKLKNQLVIRLKEKNLDPKMRKSILDDIQCIESLLSELHDRQTFYKFLVTTLLPWERKARSQIAVQIKLEKMAANDLFVAANRLIEGAQNA